MSGFVRGAILAAALSFSASQTVSAQTAGNLIANPNLDVEGPNGSPTVVASRVPPPTAFVLHYSAAANWTLLAMTFSDYRIETELVDSDLVPGGKMLHVHATNVALVEMMPGLTATPPLPSSLGFCTWIKVVHGGAVGVSVDGNGVGSMRSHIWEPLIAYAPIAMSSNTQVNVLPFASFDTPVPRLGEVEFYIQAATLALHPLATCPQKTLNSLAAGRQPPNLPPQYPVIEHPQWTDPAPQSAAPYGQGAIAPAYVPGPNTLPPPPSNAAAPAAPSNAPGGKK